MAGHELHEGRGASAAQRHEGSATDARARRSARGADGEAPAGQRGGGETIQTREQMVGVALAKSE